MKLFSPVCVFQFSENVDSVDNLMILNTLYYYNLIVFLYIYFILVVLLCTF
jgi:hypothetical protein